ncbi:hypothetical protein PM082_022173 [Marasmius tenuissimus]|nr:hypothetical protein PM082_022173 [Marasmius tenuissimus]
MNENGPKRSTVVPNQVVGPEDDATTSLDQPAIASGLGQLYLGASTGAHVKSSLILVRPGDSLQYGSHSTLEPSAGRMIEALSLIWIRT